MSYEELDRVSVIERLIIARPGMSRLDPFQCGIGIAIGPRLRRSDDPASRGAWRWVCDQGAGICRSSASIVVRCCGSIRSGDSVSTSSASSRARASSPAC